MRRGPDVLLDARITRRMSVGMRAYAEQLTARLPRVAPDLRFEVFRAGGNFGLEEQIRLPWRSLESRARIVHYLSLYAPVIMLRPFAITIHDLIHLRFPQNFKRSVRPYYATVVRWACARAARVITDDRRTADDLKRLLGVEPKKIRVIPLGVDDAFLRDAESPPSQRPYVFYAGNHRAHKDIPTLVDAWRGLGSECIADLYLTGHDDVLGLDAGPRDGGVIRFVGDVDPARLAQLYRGAAAYVHPALCEGFGLPMLEAAAVGTRVVACSDAVPGVLDGLAQTFPPRDVRRLRALLVEALASPLAPKERERMRATARAYTWERCAAATCEVYREMLNEAAER